MVDCYIRCHNIFHIFQYTSVDCCVYIAKFLCCKCSFCKKTFVDWVSIDAPWLIVVFLCILHTLIVNRHHILYTKMPPLLCISIPTCCLFPRAPYVFLTRWQYLVKNNATIPIINHDADSCDEFYCVLLCVFCNRRQLPRNHHNEIRGARCYNDDFTKL